jgi:hypothetical protein
MSNGLLSITLNMVDISNERWIFMTGTVQTTICRHISVDDLPVFDLILQLYAFFPRFCSSYFPLMQCSAK